MKTNRHACPTRDLRPRMGFPVDLLQMRRGHVRVDLRGGEIGVAQHLLDGPQVGAPLEQVGGEGVTQRVGGDVVGQPRLARIALDDRVQPLPRQPPPAVVEEQLRRLQGPGAAQEGPAPLVVGAHSFHGLAPQRHHPLLVALADGAHEPHLQVDVLQAQRRAPPRPAGPRRTGSRAAPGPAGPAGRPWAWPAAAPPPSPSACAAGVDSSRGLGRLRVGSDAVKPASTTRSGRTSGWRPSCAPGWTAATCPAARKSLHVVGRRARQRCAPARQGSRRELRQIAAVRLHGPLRQSLSSRRARRCAARARVPERADALARGSLPLRVLDGQDVLQREVRIARRLGDLADA